MARLVRNTRGFTMVESIAVLLLLAILIAATLSRGTEDIQKIDLTAQTERFRGHLRYAQSMALKEGRVWGARCDGASFWVFRGEDPDDAAGHVVLPAEADAKITLSNHKVTMSTFTLFFDGFGRPYKAYTDPDTNTPVTTADPLSININLIGASLAPNTLGVTPETGFVREV